MFARPIHNGRSQWEYADQNIAHRMTAMRERVRELLPGRAAKNGSNQHSEGGGNNVTPSQRGNASTYTHRRLNRDRPDLAAQVAAGELSANAAAIQAGFRKRKVSVTIDPAAMARTARKHFTDDELAELRQLLDRKGDR